MKRRDLERALESVPDFPSPDPSREQYRTPSGVAADLVWTAWTDGAIEGMHVLDLGCGTGVLAKAALLLGARDVMGVDSDADILQLAAQNVPGAHFVPADVATWDASSVAADTVVMNPPFGAQKSNRNADRTFLDAALRSGASTVWLLAPLVSEKFLAAFARDAKRDLSKELEWTYPLPATMAHHQDAVRTIKVGGYRLGI